jgi:uncharacterized phiE125 gp8 family phage protein
MRAAVLQASRRELVTPPTGAVLSLGDLRTRLRQKLTDDDAELQTLEEEAQHWAERYMGRSILRQTWREWFDGPFRGAVLLLREQAASIVSLKVYDPADAETTVAPTVYFADLVSEPSRLVLRESQTWPIDLREVNSIAVQYTAGWETALTVPSVIKAAIGAHVKGQYDGSDETKAIESALRPYRLRTGAA